MWYLFNALILLIYVWQNSGNVCSVLLKESSAETKNFVKVLFLVFLKVLGLVLGFFVLDFDVSFGGLFGVNLYPISCSKSGLKVLRKVSVLVKSQAEKPRNFGSAGLNAAALL